MKIAGIVIIYHPPSNLVENILTYYNYLEKIYIFDNTEAQSSAHLFTHLDKVEFIHDGENKGIAHRLNQGCLLAKEQNFDWVLTMDQDSLFPANTFNIYIQCVQQYTSQQAVAVFGIHYESYEVASSLPCKAKNTPFIITSGMLVSIPAFTILGGFDEKLFIDAVDHEYCLRANVNGFETIKFENVVLHHLVGALVYRASLKTLYLYKKKKSVHSPLRCYYLLRNALYLKEKYEKAFPQIIAHNNLVVKMHLKRSFWYGENAWKTYWYIQKAKSDFRKKKMGRIQQ